jgi:hypothetical protein
VLGGVVEVEDLRGHHPATSCVRDAPFDHGSLGKFHITLRRPRRWTCEQDLHRELSQRAGRPAVSAASADAASSGQACSAGRAFLSVPATPERDAVELHERHLVVARIRGLVAEALADRVGAIVLQAELRDPPFSRRVGRRREELVAQRERAIQLVGAARARRRGRAPRSRRRARRGRRTSRGRTRGGGRGPPARAPGGRSGDRSSAASCAGSAAAPQIV